MLRKESKLRRQKEIKYVLEKRKKVYSKNFTFYYWEKGIEVNRFLLLTPKKKFRLAVTRHRLGRRVYAILRRFRVVDEKKKCYIILVPKHFGVLKLDTQTLQKEIFKTLKFIFLNKC
jgi:ribonuclease P protein component